MQHVEGGPKGVARREEEVPAPRRFWLAFVCLFAAACMLFWYIYYPAEMSRSPDEKEHLVLGVTLADQGELVLPTGEAAKRMPLYPAFLSLVYRWQKSELWLNAVQMLQTFMAWCVVVVIALIAERLGGARAAVFAGVIAALYSPYRFLQMVFLTETMLILLLLLALLIYISGCINGGSARTRVACLIVVSLLLGLAVLTRANALIVMIPFAIDALCRSGTNFQRIGRVAAVALPAMVMAAGWGLRNRAAVGEFTLSTIGGLNFYLGNNPDYAEHVDLAQADYEAHLRLQVEEGLTEAAADARLYAMGRQYICENPGQTLRNIMSKCVVWFKPTVSQTAPTLILLGLACFAYYGSRADRVVRLVGPRRWLFLASLALLLPAAMLWLVELISTYQPWTSPLTVVPFGLIALALLHTEPRVRGLLAGIFTSQFVVALVFIPLVRIRWTVDGILIIALAVGLSRLCDWLSNGSLINEGKTA